jgi:hypothetical protein
MSLMYQGRAKLYQVRSTSNVQDDLKGAIILVAQNETKRYAGLVLEGTRSMCGHVCHKTHIPDVIVCMDTKDPNKDWKFQKSIDHEEVNLLTHIVMRIAPCDESDDFIRRLLTRRTRGAHADT